MQQSKFRLQEILAKAQPIDFLTVHSFEMSIYLVELTIGEQKGFVYEGDRPKRFNSSQHIREAFSPCRVAACHMLHTSPYDEMIGNPDSAQEHGVLPFSMGRND